MSKVVKGKPSNLAVSAKGGKRRSTLNSREAGYNEEEELLRAIEASKAEDAHPATTNKKGKRSRSGSEEYVHFLAVNNW